MTTNQVSITVRDGGLGSTEQPNFRTAVVMGCCSSGTAAAPALYASKSSLIADFGYGPAVELACMMIDAGGQVLFARTTGTTIGSCSTVNHVGVIGTAVPTITTATAYDDGDWRFIVDTGGALGTAGIIFRYSQDNGRSYSAPVALGTALTYTIPNAGIVVTLGSSTDTLIAGDVFFFQSHAPLWADADVQAAMVAVGNVAPTLLSEGTWGADMWLTGTATASDLAAFSGYLDTLATTAKQFTRLVIQARDVNNLNGLGGTQETEAAWIASLQTAFLASSTLRVIVAAGHYNVTSSITGRTVRRSLLFPAGKRKIQVASPAIHIGQVDLGGLPNTSIGPASDLLPYHDERVTPGLDGSRFMTLWTIPRQRGYFIKNPNIMSTPGSDFTIQPLGDVMDLACSTLYAAEILYMNRTVRIDPVTGKILEQDALAVELDVGGKLKQALTAPGFASAVAYSVSRADNIQSTKTITTTTNVTALGYILAITSTVQFQNLAFAN